MATGKPSITTPRAFELRLFQQSIDNIRERITGIETQVDLLTQLAGANSAAKSIAALTGQLNQIRAVLNALPGGAEMASLLAVFAQPNGLVVMKDGTLITRVLRAGSLITITYPDGALSAPIISAEIPDTIPLAPTDPWDWSDQIPGPSILDGAET